MYFTDKMIDDMREGAYRLLEQLGACVPRADVREGLARRGFRVAGERVFVSRERAHAQYARLTPPAPPEHPARHVRCGISAYAHTYESLSGKLSPISTEDNARMAQFVTRAGRDWPMLHACAPGHPVDVPAHAQFLYQAAHSYLWCPDSGITEPMCVDMAPFYFEMAEAVGRPIGHLPVYVSSPLMIAGESLDIVLAYGKRAGHVTVTTMPCLGASTPLNLVAAYAQVIAETLCGAVVVEELTGVPAAFSPTLFNMDYRAMTMAFGTPEKLLLEWLNQEVYARLAGGEPQPGATDIHVMAHRAGVQAAVEKGMLAMAGAMRGSRFFHTVGSLAMDEVFSPVQMLLDLEILSSVERVIQGLPIDDYEGDIVEEVRAALGRGYMDSDRTLDGMARFVWYPNFFTRKSLGAAMEGKAADCVANARERASEMLADQPAWHLDAATAAHVMKIVREATRAAGGAT